MARLMKASLQRGDLIQVEWVDIAESPTGDPEEAELVGRKSVGYFWARRENRGLPVVITTTTIDDGSAPGQNGYCIYPEACVTKIRVIRRARRATK